MLRSKEVPPFEVFYPRTEQLDAVQRSFYDELCRALDRGRALDVGGNISYLFLYAYRVLEACRAQGFEGTAERLDQLRNLYPHEPKFAEGCRLWSLDCLLGMKKYDEYLAGTELTETEDIFRKATHPGNLRCNVARLAGKPANAVDLVRISGFRASKFTRGYPHEFRAVLAEHVAEEAERNGDWLDRCMRMADVQTYEHRLFSGAPIDQPKASFQAYAYYSVSAFLREIEAVARAAQKALRQRLKTQSRKPE